MALSLPADVLWEEYVKKVIRCNVCLVIKPLRLLHCQHKTCKRCIGRITKEGKIRCPECQQLLKIPIGGFPLCHLSDFFREMDYSMTQRPNLSRRKGHTCPRSIPLMADSETQTIKMPSLAIGTDKKESNAKRDSLSLHKKVEGEPVQVKVPCKRSFVKNGLLSPNTKLKSSSKSSSGSPYTEQCNKYETPRSYKKLGTDANPVEGSPYSQCSITYDLLKTYTNLDPGSGSRPVNGSPYTQVSVEYEPVSPYTRLETDSKPVEGSPYTQSSIKYELVASYKRLETDV